MIGYFLKLKEQQSGGSGPTNPIFNIGNLVAWWDRDGIDPSATAVGNNVNNWTDVVGGKVLIKVLGTQPVLEINSGKRAVLFNGVSALSIAEWSAIDFTPRVNPFTIIAKVGNNAGVAGSLVAKAQNGQASLQYQLNYHSTSVGELGQNVGSVVIADHFASGVVPGGPPLLPNKVASLAVGTAAIGDTTLYYDTSPVTYNNYNHPSNETIGTAVNNHPLFIGARRNDSDTAIGYQHEGSIAHVLIFNKKLSAGEIAIVVANLD